MNQGALPVQVATAFVRTLESGDMTAAARYVADDVVFEGPLSRFTGAGSFLAAMGEFAQAVTAVRFVAALGDKDQAMLAYEMETGPFGTLRAMEHFEVRDGKITKDTIVFDSHPVRSARAA